jgi:2-keto-4-pentenoate hydratase/2-oxohepta-3-ene-1,7-dioic acid hydratase in catechol pathway
MRIANVADRLALLVDGGYVDVAKASDGLFAADPQAVWEDWPAFVSWAGTCDAASTEVLPYDETQLCAPVPRPRQVFAIGLNYDEHAAESGFVRPTAPLVFTKYPSSLTGPVSTVALPTPTVDWEVELVVVIGRTARAVSPAEAWSYVAALTAGQDLSERTSQHSGPAPQFSLAKSFPGFSPTGPCLVTPDELADPTDLELSCAIDGERRQVGRTSQMIFPVAELVAYLSTIVTLYPGDLIFTGTPAGVGAGRTPPLYLRDGQVLVSRVEGIGELVQTFTKRR